MVRMAERFVDIFNGDPAKLELATAALTCLWGLSIMAGGDFCASMVFRPLGEIGISSPHSVAMPIITLGLLGILAVISGNITARLAVAFAAVAMWSLVTWYFATWLGEPLWPAIASYFSLTVWEFWIVGSLARVERFRRLP